MNEATDNRQKILQTALSLFARKGYDAVSTLEITNEAGITKPTMYYYFGSKEGLLAEVLNTYYTRFLKELEAVTTLPEDMGLTFFRLMKVYFDNARNNRDFIIFKSSFYRIGEDTAYLVAKPYIEAESKIIENVFNLASQYAGNIKGKERTCSISFIGTATATINAFLHTADQSLFSDETIYLLRQQFLYGIYS